MNLKNANQRVLTFGPECEWLDIGRPEDYRQAIENFENDRDYYLRIR
jgi:NDP-sugar pyrophosphorylase family protein